MLSSLTQKSLPLRLPDQARLGKNLLVKCTLTRAFCSQAYCKIDRARRVQAQVWVFVTIRPERWWFSNNYGALDAQPLRLRLYHSSYYSRRTQESVQKLVHRLAGARAAKLVEGECTRFSVRWSASSSRDKKTMLRRNNNRVRQLIISTRTK